jgi:hypothetical protein
MDCQKPLKRTRSLKRCALLLLELSPRFLDIGAIQLMRGPVSSLVFLEFQMSD